MKRMESEDATRPKGLGIRIVPLSNAVVSAPVRRSLFILFAAAGLVLLLACANIANLLLVQVSLRSGEIAVRTAIGAPPTRLLRQFLTESLFVSFAGGTAGLLLAWWGTNRVMKFMAAHVPRSQDVSMNWSVFAFSFMACAISGVMFGIVPALNAMRADPRSILNDAGHSSMDVRQRRLRDALVVAEIALAFVLAVGATLLVRELVRMRNTELGMIPENVITIHVGQPLQQAGDGRQYYEIAQRVRQIPGVREAGFTQMVPLQSSGWGANSIDFVRGTPPDAVPYKFELRYVTPGYFRALGIPIIRGRGFSEQDVRGAARVIVINEALARQQFGSDDPIGKMTSRGMIVGLIADVRQVHLDRPAVPEIYYPIAQNWSQLGELGMSLIVKTAGPPLALTEEIRAAIREVNPRVAIFSIKTMDRVIRESLSDFLLYLELMLGFAVLALLLACTGTYGVISFLASSRDREFAIRSALGAGQKEVARLVLRDAIRLTATGLAGGMVIVLIGRSVLSNLPVSVHGPDVWTTMPVAVAISVLTISACWIPARRAATSDPMTALRKD
jgi:predicted permease